MQHSPAAKLRPAERLCANERYPVAMLENT